MSACLIKFGGVELLLDAAGAVYWPLEKTLVISDLHLEKGSSFVRAGRFLPPFDTRETLRGVSALIDRYQPARLVLLGDSFHDRAAWLRMDATDKREVSALMQAVEIIWIEGNHDRGFVPDGAQLHEVFRCGNIVFRHITQGEENEISGHYHPSATLHHRGSVLRRACFVLGDRGLIMPAFGQYTGGLDICDPAFDNLISQSAELFLTGEERIIRLPAAKLRHKRG